MATSKEDERIFITGELLTCESEGVGGVGGAESTDGEPGIIVTACETATDGECE